MPIPTLIVLCALAKTTSAAVASTFTVLQGTCCQCTPRLPTSARRMGYPPNGPTVAGAVFDRFIQYGFTHTGEPNYLAAGVGDFWGLYNDNFEYIPNSVPIIVDLDEKDISWARISIEYAPLMITLATTSLYILRPQAQPPHHL
ncbi:hypothetical protein BU15DRAFT_65273 [Melanogaster broomeanus]|nr:hypothetical protein BU15DRAFT_65273 [Melanogaster broomeanus]